MTSLLNTWVLGHRAGQNDWQIFGGLVLYQAHLPSQGKGQGLMMWLEPRTLARMLQHQEHSLWELGASSMVDVPHASSTSQPMLCWPWHVCMYVYHTHSSCLLDGMHACILGHTYSTIIAITRAFGMALYLGMSSCSNQHLPCMLCACVHAHGCLSWKRCGKKDVCVWQSCRSTWVSSMGLVYAQ